MANPVPAGEQLRSRLAAVLPKGYKFDIYHLSTPPTKTEALYAPPPKERPERTYCEKHFLAISIDAPSPEANDKRLIVLGLEIYIFSTARTTTVFVSKADSTGFLNLLNLPRGTPSPIRTVCATFIDFLVENRRRKDVQLVVSLFARAQDQYLFPGSVEYKGKHVLDDRGLVKWWCRVLNPLLNDPVDGYLFVPGLEEYDMRVFIPKGTSHTARWSVGHPLLRISHYAKEFDWVPPRCLIPQFPDDPKSRYRSELDDESLNSADFRNTGTWTTIRTLDTFWEMMAYRQECSSGRLTGFIWIVFDDKFDQKVVKREGIVPPVTPTKQQRTVNITPTTTPRKLFPAKPKTERQQPDERKEMMMKKKEQKRRKKKLTGPIIPREPRRDAFKKKKHLLNRPTSTAYYSWTVAARGELIVADADYKRIMELLLHLDFSTLDKAALSTRRWVSEVGTGDSWGYHIEGTAELPPPPQESSKSEAGDSAQVNNLTNLVKRKRSDTTGQDAPQVNVLGAGLVRKKSKPEEEEPEKPAVNVLSAGLVRKKPKE